MKTTAPQPKQATEPETHRAAPQPDQRPAAVAQRQQQAAIDASPGRQTQALPARLAAPNRTGLPDQLKAGVENLSGYSLDDVQVHYNSAKPAQLQALAYAQGTNIHVAPGQEKHLPHEAWHVVQQKQGRVRPTMQMKGAVQVNDNVGLEQEADVMGRKALQKHQQIATTHITTNYFPQSEVLQGLFVNANNDPAKYPHLHTVGQYIGYTYSPGHHVQLRANGGDMAPGWFQTVGIAIDTHFPRGMNVAQRANHDAILNWIAANEQDVWANRR